MRCLGAGHDPAYIGSRFIATEEANADQGYKDMQKAQRTILSIHPCLPALRAIISSSIAKAGLDPDNLPDADKSKMNFGSGGNMKTTWKDIWGSGQGIGGIEKVQTIEEVVAEMERDYREAIDSSKARKLMLDTTMRRLIDPPLNAAAAVIGTKISPIK